MGNTGDLFAGIAFDSGGILYGVTDEDALVPETLFELSTDDATPTAVLTLGGGGDGEALAANLDDGQLYRASGAGLPNVDEIFESIDPLQPVVDGISLSGDDYQEALALTYEGSDVLLLADAAPGLYRVGTDGAVTLVGGLNHASKGLAVVPSVDCALLDPSASVAAPVEVTDVELLSAAPTVVDWSLQDSELWYDVVGGLLSELRADAGTDSSTCLQSGIGGSSFGDARPDPPLLDGFYYLIRAQSTCMRGSYGHGTSGLERQPTDTCP